MSECRALTNFTGNAVASLPGQNPFDELSLEPDAHGASTSAEAARPTEGEKVAVN